MTNTGGLARNNHYIPRAVLKRWAPDGSNVYAYRLLVSHAEVPLWTYRQISGLAYQRDLYTTFEGSTELDAVERWLQTGYEDDGLEVIDKIIGNRRRSPADWRALTLFLAAQDLRTPLSYLEFREWCDKNIPSILEETLKKGVAEAEEAHKTGQQLRIEPLSGPFSKSFQIRIQRPRDEQTQPLIGAEVAVGRDLWIQRMQHALTGVARTLAGYRWSLLEPFGNEEWPLADHPVLRLNYHQNGQYDFKGGWGSPGTEIMMPLSPRHLLYTQVGQKHDYRVKVRESVTRQLQRFMVERALRWVFASQPFDWIPQAKPRRVDKDQFETEDQIWRDWHDLQREENAITV